MFGQPSRQGRAAVMTAAKAKDKAATIACGNTIGSCRRNAEGDAAGSEVEAKCC